MELHDLEKNQFFRSTPQKGDKLELQLNAYLLDENGKIEQQLSSDEERGGVFSYVFGKQHTLEGFNEEVCQMTVGERREIVAIVGDLGLRYRPNWPKIGFDILPKSKIKFEVVLCNIIRAN